MLKLYIGLSGSGKTSAMLRRIAEDAAAARPGALLIVPEQYSHENERRLCELGGDSVCLYAEVLSFTRLASRVFAELGQPDGSVLDNGGRLLVMCRALELTRGSLRVYDRASSRPEFMARLISAVDEFKSCLITPEQLMSASLDSEGTLADKLHDLSLIYAAYTGICDEGMFDPRDTLTRCAELIAGSSFAEGHRVYIDSFADFTMQELGVIEAFLRCGCDVTVALTCDRLDSEPDASGLFARARRTAARLLQLARDCMTESEVIYPTKTPDRHPVIGFIAQHLFADAAEPFAEEAPVELYSASSPYAECEWAAGRIIELVKGGLRWRDVAVVARDFETYGELIETVFEKYAIPLYLSRMTDILQKPVLALVISALETVSGGYEYDDIFRYLRTGLTNLSPSECDLLENYVLKWDIRGKLWTREEPWSFNPSGYSDTLSDPDRLSLERIDALRRRAAAPLGRLRKAGLAEKTAAGQAAALYAFMVDIHLAETLERKAARFAEAGELQLADEYAQLWDILCGALDKLVEILAQTPMTQDEFTRLFRLLLSQYDVGSIPVSFDRVTAADMTRLRRRDVRCLIVLGASDDALPTISVSPGILTDDDRVLLEGLGIELLSDATTAISKEMDAIYTCFTMPTERLIVSCPQAGADGTEKRMSFVMKRLQRLFALSVTREEDLSQSFRTRAPLPCLELAAAAAAGSGGRYSTAAFCALNATADGRARLDYIRRAAEADRGRLSRMSVKTLYGDKFRLSASRAEKFYSCRFSYFMQYGLKAKPRKKAGFQAPEIGTFMHFVLENVCREVRKLGGFGKTDKDLLSRLTRKYVTQYISGTLDNFRDKTPRFQYLFNRLYNTVFFVVTTMGEELSVSDFEPLDFELSFGGKKADMPAIEISSGEAQLSLTGLVDRVDGWVDDGRLYLRVVDYKTGVKSFDLSDLWYGMGMQMLIYLFALQKYGAERYGAAEIIPAGVLYTPARDVTVSVSRELTDEQISAKAAEQLRRSGLILNDNRVIEAMEHSEDHRFLPIKYNKNGSISASSADKLASTEQFGRLSKLIDRLLGEIASELYDGSVDADPYYRSQQATACTYCDYRSACQFDEGSGDCYRYITKLKPAELWSRLDEEGKEESSIGISAD